MRAVLTFPRVVLLVFFVACGGRGVGRVGGTGDSPSVPGGGPGGSAVAALGLDAGAGPNRGEAGDGDGATLGPDASTADSDDEKDVPPAVADAEPQEGWDASRIESDPASGDPAADYLIVAADELLASARRYGDFRTSAGFHVALATVGDIVGEAPDAASASARIRDYVRARFEARDTARPMYLLLFGDAQASWPGDGSGVPAGAWSDPSSAQTVVSDNVYADMDGDDVPDLAVGRITAHDDGQADLVRAKVAAYEAQTEVGDWDRRINIFASTSGMGDFVDAAIESVVYDITEAIPYAYSMTMTYARQSSPYVYVPEHFSDEVFSRIDEGSLLVAYAGHGYLDGFATLDWNGTAYPILDTGHLEKMVVTHKSPVLVFVACSTGAFAGQDCVSERILVQQGAPTAIMSSTDVSDPYPNAIFVYEISQAFTRARSPTLGNAFMRAKQRMINNDDAVRQQIDALAGLLVDASARTRLEHSHLHMFTLFGDPGMAIRYVGVAEVGVDPASASGGATLQVTASFPAPLTLGDAQITLESPRKVITSPMASVPPDGDPGRDAVIVANYQAANDKVVSGATADAKGASLVATLIVPANLPPGQYYVKVFAKDGHADYAGSTPVTIH